MSVVVKICGLNSIAAVEAATGHGAHMVGFVFYPPSPRYVTPEAARPLVAAVPSGIDRVGVFVDPDDALLTQVLAKVSLDMLQLHGSESPARVRAIRKKFGLPVIKAFKVAGPDDTAKARAYDGIADWLMFDAPPIDRADALPGGNGVVFDWRLLCGQGYRRPWILSGGLDAKNVTKAVRVSGASAIDVSSGVEDAPGRKNADRIKAFLDVAARL
jgi:phosphoribosylanthranilate isomerase